jgi:hypothetical protein
VTERPKDRREILEATMPAFDVAAYTIVCDESGATGQNLTDPNQRIFVHASTDLNPEAAADVVQRVRRATRIQAAANEIKWKDIAKSPRQRRAAIESGVFGADGPLAGHAMANVIDKPFMLVAKVIDLLAEEIVYETQGNDYLFSGAAREDALILFRSGPRAFGQQRWTDLLQLFQSVVRGKEGSVAEFFGLIDDLRLRGHRRDVERVMALVWSARHRGEELLTNSSRMPTLNPLMTALPSTVRAWWNRVHEPIYVIHDQQTDLPEDTVRIMQYAMYSRGFMPRVLFAGMGIGDSKKDPRIQVADLVAGAVRDATTQVLKGQVPPDLLIGHLLGPGTMWPH